MIRIGLVGAGSMAGVYAQSAASLPNADVTAVASPNTAETFVAEQVPTGTAYSDAETMFDKAAIDAVAVLTPTHTHHEFVEGAAERGLDVICEKPIARTLDQAARIRTAVEESGITFLTAHVVRFFPEYAEAKRLVESGDIGTPGVARARRAFGIGGNRGWFEDREKSGGVLLDVAVHDFDYLRWVFGDVEEVFTRRTNWTREARSEVSITLAEFENGAKGHVEAWTVQVSNIPFTTTFELCGDKGLIEFDLEDVRPYVVHDGETTHVPRDPVGDDLPIAQDGYDKQLEHFLACIEGDAEPLIPVEEGIESLRVSLAAIESAERGVPVDPSEVNA